MTHTTTQLSGKNPPVAKTRKFSPEEYYQLGSLGFFDQQSVELIGGEIIEMAPVNPEHSVSVNWNAQKLIRLLGEAYYVLIQNPLRIGESEPQPDLAIVSGAPQDYKKTHPQTALLVIEVADTSLEYDRSVKASLYASGGVPEYWIVNLRERCMEVYREPEPDSDSPFLARYRQVATLQGEASLAPLFKPDLHLTVAELLP